MLGAGASICRQWRLKNDWGEEIYLLIILKKNKIYEYESTTSMWSTTTRCQIKPKIIYLCRMFVHVNRALST